MLWFNPTLFGLFQAPTTTSEFISNVGVLWLTVGVGGLVFRTVQLFVQKDVLTGVVWFTKILTDPFHDIKLYYRAPFYLLKGDIMDDTVAAHHHG